jgi:hypothetical protein
MYSPDINLNTTDSTSGHHHVCVRFELFGRAFGEQRSSEVMGKFQRGFCSFSRLAQQVVFWKVCEERNKSEQHIVLTFDCFDAPCKRRIRILGTVCEERRRENST